jgi:TetR/AcrR family transcriptional regulator, transcriptional repressor of aconitase
MPKVSDDHKERRRAQILEAARGCFARHGYEGATVAKLEEATGLSRGAIFNYFENKQALFVELALESSLRLTDLWLEHGHRALFEELLKEDPDWLAVQLEAVRRIRTDPEFKRQLAAHERELEKTRPARLERLQALGVRQDFRLDDIALFLSVVANGIALQISTGDRLPDVDVMVSLLETGVGPRKGGKATGRERATTLRGVRGDHGNVRRAAGGSRSSGKSARP